MMAEPILGNNLGITDATALRQKEEEFLYAALQEAGSPSPKELLTSHWLQRFHYAVFGQLYDHAGTFRDNPIRVNWHVPSAQTIEEVVIQMAGYEEDCRRRIALVEQNPNALPALLGFGFWKLGYIAPFSDGNGRIANGLFILLQRYFGLAGCSLYDKNNPAEYSEFIGHLRSYDAGNASPFFEYLGKKLEGK